ncbi:MAG: hypothetical protein ACKVP4_00990 [Hyphomicrobium sp.]
MKNALITIIIATMVAVLAPRDMSEAARLMIRAGIVLIQIAVRLDPPGYGAGEAETEPDGDHDPQQDAGLRAVAGCALVRAAER